MSFTPYLISTFLSVTHPPSPGFCRVDRCAPGRVRGALPESRPPGCDAFCITQNLREGAKSNLGIYDPPLPLSTFEIPQSCHTALFASDVVRQRLIAASAPPTTLSRFYVLREANLARKIPEDLDYSPVPQLDFGDALDLPTQLVARYAARSWIPLKETVLDTVKASL